MLFSGKPSKKSILKAVLNPNIIFSIIGLLVYCFSITLPRPIYLSVKYISQMNTTLSMIVIGTTMTQISFKKIFSGIHIWIGVAVRNIILPFAILFVLYTIGIRGELLFCSLIPAACPVAGFSVIFSKLENKDVMFPCKLMTLSTLVSLVTMLLVLGVIRIL